ncbi:TIGR02647 family protein, partial [Gammaproteobacteria bacterium]|nr:TIGR02647 family protein [Gammaproteobacteria bacterium]
LIMFDARNPLEGIKVHHEADPGKIDAAKRLHELGIITLSDGGYLTPRGQEAIEHAEALINILQARPH